MKKTLWLAILLGLGLFLSCKQEKKLTLQEQVFQFPSFETIPALAKYNPGLKYFRARIGHQEREAVAYQPFSRLSLGEIKGERMRFFLGVIPQYFARHSEPISYQVWLEQGEKKETIFKGEIAPSSDAHWKKIELELAEKKGKLFFSAEVKDWGLFLTAPRYLSQTPPEKPNIIFILIDALRADHLGCYGYPLPTSPDLDELARSGALFLNAYTASPFTVTSLASIFTGLYPWEHRVIFAYDLHLKESFLTLAEVLQKAGYQTAGFSAVYFLPTSLGLSQGFELSNESCASSFFFGDAQCLTEQVIKWLEQEASPPFFLYIHYVSTHAPYRAPEFYQKLFSAGIKKPGGEVGKGEILRFGKHRRWYQLPRSPTEQELKWLISQYDGEIRYANDQIARLLEYLRRKGIYQKSLILVIADHGEAFFEHKKMDHTEELHRSVARIPLILTGPGIPAGKRITQVVRSIDFAPTILEYLGISGLSQISGKSFLSLLKKEKIESRSALSVRFLNRKKFQISLVKYPYHFLLYFPKKKNIELYRIDRDPQEKNNLAPTNPELVEKLLSLVPDYQTVLLGKKPAPGKYDQETIRRLKSLGYME